MTDTSQLLHLENNCTEGNYTALQIRKSRMCVI